MNASIPPAASDAVQLDGVSLLRDGIPALQNVSLSLTERRIGLIGHNGSGKSSLVRLLNGLLQPDQGRVRVHGTNPADGPEALANEVGFIFQNPDHQIIFPTVIEELIFGLLNQGSNKAEAEQQARDLLAAHGHASWADRPVHALSEGQKQWVCIFSVVLMQPRLLILDEPFSALDLPTRYRLLHLLHQLPQQIIMVSHDLDTLADFDRIVWLEDGKVRSDGPPATLLPAYQADARALQATAAADPLP